MQIPAVSVSPTPSRAPRADDREVVPFARDLADRLQENGLADASFEKVLATMDRLATDRLTTERVEAVRDLFGGSRWSTGTYVQVARRMDSVREFHSWAANQRPSTVELLDRLTSMPQEVHTVPADLEALGYTPKVARQLVEQQPGVAADVALWADAEPAQARPTELYRTMALPGGLAGYDPERLGNANGEIYFSDNATGALQFGVSRVASKPGTEGVMLHCQIPRFMVEGSPPQMGDMSWPILRSQNLPDPERPDIRPYIADFGSFSAQSSEVA